jgi:hypothetical protein
MTNKAFSSIAGIMTFYQVTGPGTGKWMTYNTVSRFYIPCLWSSVVAFSTIGVSHTSVEISRCVALFAGVSIMWKKLCGGSGSGAATALKVTGETFSGVEGVMIFN